MYTDTALRTYEHIYIYIARNIYIYTDTALRTYEHIYTHSTEYIHVHGYSTQNI